VPQDPQAAKLMDSIRRGDPTAFKQLLRESPKTARGQGPGGSTPLMYAALYGDALSVGLLLDQGADSNARNDAGAKNQRAPTPSDNPLTVCGSGRNTTNPG